MVRRLGAAALAGAIACLAAASLATAAAPQAVTGAVTAFGATSATVSGAVNPGGQATTWTVEYGKTTSYGSTTAATSAGSGSASVNVSTTISGLTPTTTYHYRFVATNSAGTAQGADGVFTTSAAQAPDVVTGTATVSGASATLTGTVNPNGRAATWYFEYGTGTGYGTKTPAQNAGSGTSATGVSAPVTGLQAGRTYHFRLVATSDAGTGRGADRTFSLGSAPSVSTRSASAVSSTTAQLNGRVDPNGQETSWRFEYGTSTGYGSSTATQSAGSGTSTRDVSFSLSGLAPGTTYHYRVVATNASGASFGGDQSFATGGAAPAAETGAAQGVGTTAATLTGTVDTRGRTTTWRFEYGTSTRYGSSTSTVRADANVGRRGVSAVVAGLAPGVTYHFRLVATSSAGTTRGADAAFTTTGASLTFARPALLAVYGRAVTLSGTASGGGIAVAVLAERFGESGFSTVATVRTDGNGRWSYAARPTIRTSYRVSANGVTTQPFTIGVRPSVSLRRIAGGRLSSHVGAGKSFAGRSVQLQRRVGNRWVTIRRARLNAGSTAIFRAAALPRGTSTIRIAMSVNQAGPGYLAGFSRTIRYSR